MVAGLKNTSVTDIVFPTAGPTAGVIDDETCDAGPEAEMGESDVTDDDDDDEDDDEMDTNTADTAHVRLSTDLYHVAA